jgi:hypothetical protein
MMANPAIGTCTCPLCTATTAEVRQGVKGALYICCDTCVSQIRTMSRAGRERIAALVKPTDPAPAPAPAPAPTPAPKTKAKPAPAPAPAPQPQPAKDQPWFLR